MINKITYPESTISRMNRYIRKGFYICNGELYKIIQSIGKKYIEEHENNKIILSDAEQIREEQRKNIISFDLASVFLNGLIKKRNYI